MPKTQKNASNNMSSSNMSSRSTNTKGVARAGCLRSRPGVWASLSMFALLCTLFLHGGDACSDVVRLRTGESIKGRLLQTSSDPDVLVVEDFLSGAMRRLSWDVVSPTDRDRIQEDWGWKNKNKRVVKAHVVRHRLSNGEVVEVEGLVEENNSAGVKIRFDGRVEFIPKDRLVGEVLDQEVDPRTIWNQEQLYKRFLDGLSKEEGVDINNLTSIQRWRCAEMAVWVGELDIALEHYNACAADESFTRAGVAKSRAEHVKALLADAAGLAKLRQISRTISIKKFGRAKTMVEAFADEHPESRKPVLERLEKIKKRLETERTEFFQRMAGNRLIKIVDKLISVKVRDRELTLGDATNWARRGLEKAAFEILAANMAKHDEEVNADKARTYWDGRPKRGWSSATYAAGTFVVRPPKVKQPRRRSNRSRKRKKSKGPQVRIEIPKPPNKEQFWERAKGMVRTSWLMAFFAENSDLFEIHPKERKSKCPQCNGAGLQTKSMSNGAQLHHLCVRCAGAQMDVRIRFR